MILFAFLTSRWFLRAVLLTVFVILWAGIAVAMPGRTAACALPDVVAGNTTGHYVFP